MGQSVNAARSADTLVYEKIVPTQKEASAMALGAGVDLDITYEPACMKPLIENVEEGRVPEALVDRQAGNRGQLHERFPARC